MITQSRKDAKAAGYRALTSRYSLPEEQWMLDGVLADLRRASVDHVVVRDGRGVSVWRRAPGRAGQVENLRYGRLKSLRYGARLRAGRRVAA